MSRNREADVRKVGKSILPTPEFGVFVSQVVRVKTDVDTGFTHPAARMQPRTVALAEFWPAQIPVFRYFLEKLRRLIRQHGACARKDGNAYRKAKPNEFILSHFSSSLCDGPTEFLDKLCPGECLGETVG